MATVKVSSLSREYVRVPVNAYEAGQLVDPSLDPVEMAFTAVGVEPVAGDWKLATWEADFSGSRPIYYSRILIGPGGTVTLADGTYDTWVRVTDSPEVPVARVGRVLVE